MMTPKTTTTKGAGTTLFLSTLIRSHSNINKIEIRPIKAAPG